ncbi:methyltransferase domain-containing protein [Colletotrichum chrysophilum]|uniref:Methyltransferase domain-containing protein n=1 Tax=Colletotrichum chrysophilum TaxID=1836956 RepID=A0AAD9AU01_9PEZI|nr:methyltransferase domain-containing protein [Colletotrichum chrysophilum]
MADTTGTEKTFRSYTSTQGMVYARGRPGYRPDLYKLIIDYHVSTGGALDLLLDVGCGAGTATREISPYFAQAVGIDPSSGMIAAATSADGVALPANERIRFGASGAEQLGSNLSPPIADGSVDLITAATAAHYFDMPRFWNAAARVLKPGGTVALWRGSFLHIHPSTPNYDRINTALQSLRERLSETNVNQSTQGGTTYETLPLPWNLESPVVEFDETMFYRKVWNDNGSVTTQEEYFMNHQTMSLDVMEAYLSSISPVARWRQVHKDIAETEQDIVKVFIRQALAILRDGGVEHGREAIVTGMSGVLMMFKKRS